MLDPMILTICVLAIVCCLPDSAHAWGAGTHLQLDMTILDSLTALPAPVATIIGGAPRDFLYGCVAADIIVGKKFTHYLLHCHRWQVGRAVLARAKTPAQQSCAYGYLSHLAADTIAHNYYVPYKLMKSFPTLSLNHAYWEARFDCFVPKQVWDTGHQVARENYRENDKLLRGVLADTIFSFGTNKRLFDSLLLLNRLKRWQQALAALGKTTRWPLEEADRQECFQLTCSATLSLLQEFDDSPWLAADPTGERALAAAGKVRRNLHLLWLDGKLAEADANRLLLQVKSILRDGMLHQDRLLKLTVS